MTVLLAPMTRITTKQDRYLALSVVEVLLEYQTTTIKVVFA